MQKDESLLVLFFVQVFEVFTNLVSVTMLASNGVNPNFLEVFECGKKHS